MILIPHIVLDACSFKNLIDLVGEDKVKRGQDDLLRVVEDPLIEGLGREAAHRVA